MKKIVFSLSTIFLVAIVLAIYDSDLITEENFPSSTPKYQNSGFFSKSFALKNRKTESPCKNNNTPTIQNNFDHYEYILKPSDNFCGRDYGQDLLFVGFVPITPKNTHQRASIRTTWAKYQSNETFRVAFVIGKSEDENVNRALEIESKLFDDIVQVNFADTYFNLTTKSMMGFRWVSTYCSNAKYTLKVDDDVVVNINVLNGFMRHLVTRHAYQDNTILCKYYEKATVFRDKSSKFFLTREEHPQDFYDPYCDGPSYLLTTDLTEKMYELSLCTAAFRFEDVFMGILAKRLNVTYIDLTSKYRFQTWENRKNLTMFKDNLFFYATSPIHFEEMWSTYVSKF
jgi:beta-1,3-galactosyltransferase 1